MNKAVLSGSVARPELKKTPSNYDIFSFGVGVREKKGDKYETVFYDCAVFGERSHKAAEKIVKGKKVLVIGKMQNRKYTTKAGVEKEKTSILVDQYEVFDVVYKDSPERKNAMQELSNTVTDIELDTKPYKAAKDVSFNLDTDSIPF